MEYVERQRGDKIRGDCWWVAAPPPPPPPTLPSPPTDQIRLWWNKVSLGLHETLSFIDTAYFNTGSHSTLCLANMRSKQFSFFYLPSCVGPRVQGQTVLILIPLCSCVTNNPIQTRVSLSPDLRPVSSKSLHSRGGEACLNLPARSIGGTRVYTSTQFSSLNEMNNVNMS